MRGLGMWARRRDTFALILAITWLAFALRIAGLTAQSLWRDEVDALRFATQPLPVLLEMFRRHGENGPLFFLTLRPWLQLAGRSEFALRFPATLAGTLAVPASYALLRRLTGRRGPAAVAALLSATAPYAVWYGQEAKMYALLLAWAALTMYLTLRAGRAGGLWRWSLLYILTSLGFYLHLLAVLIVPVQALWLILAPSLAPALPRGQVLRRRLSGLVYLAFLVLPYLPLARWQVPLWLAADTQTGYPFVPLPTILLVLLVAYSRGILPTTDLATLLPMTLAWLAGVGLWALLADVMPEPASRRRWPVVVLLLVWLFWPAVGIYIISLRRPIFADRYLIWTLPAFLGLASLGVAALARLWRPFAAAMLAAAVALNLTAVIGQAQPIKADFRAAARFVMAHRQPGDRLLFQIPYNRYTFVYYSGELDSWLDGPYTNHGMSAAELDQTLRRATADLPVVWLIASETSLWDERGLTEAWLETHGRPTMRAKFTRVTVTRYELR